jgi:hydroxyacylglutathione hydrolase
VSALEIMDNLFFIERGYLNGNHFAYRSDKPVLIDTGYRTDFHETEKFISELGIQISDVDLIISTHCHCDHIGGNRIIQDRSGCDIALHPVGRYFVEMEDDWSTWSRYYSQEADFFRCTRTLEEGDVATIGPHEFRIIHTPGHASDGISMYNQKEKVLFSSDALWEFDVPTLTIRIEGSTAVQSFKESLEKLAALDVEIVYPGHGKPFTDFEGALQRSRKKIREYLSDTQKIGQDLLKKIMVYTLLMKKSVPEDAFFDWLMGTYWYKETIDFYFSGEHEKKYDEIMAHFLDRGVVVRKNGYLSTTVRP